VLTLIIIDGNSSTVVTVMLIIKAEGRHLITYINRKAAIA